jgi:imidazole glycerol-phosphate synthase subunit HisH
LKIAIIDYGMGNLRSVEKAFERVGARGAFVTCDPTEIAEADKAVLPGDGAFDATMDNLRAAGIDRVVFDFVSTGKPFLGICIGMQALLTSSEEGRRGVVGLNLIPGIVRRFPEHGLKVPLIGWLPLQLPRCSKLFAGIEPGESVYFLHSFYCDPSDTACTAATADYGAVYCAGIEQDNIFATQFHPEKSGDTGLRILHNFASL